MWHNTLLSAVRITRYKSLRGIRINAWPFTPRLLTRTRMLRHTHTHLIPVLAMCLCHPNICRYGSFFRFKSACIFTWLCSGFLGLCKSKLYNTINKLYVHLPWQSMRRLMEKTWYTKCVLARIGGFTDSIFHLDSPSQRLSCLRLHPMNIWGPLSKDPGKAIDVKPVMSFQHS